MLLFVRYDMLICKEWILCICPYLQRKPEIDRNCMFDYTRINVFFDQGFSMNIHEPAKNRNAKSFFHFAPFEGSSYQTMVPVIKLTRSCALSLNQITGWG